MTDKKTTKDQIKSDQATQEIIGAEELDDADLDDAAGGAFLTIDARSTTFNKVTTSSGAGEFGGDFLTADLLRDLNTADGIGSIGSFDKLKR